MMMRNVVVFGTRPSSRGSVTAGMQTVVVDGVQLHCGLLRLDDRGFDPAAPATREHVLVRTRAFSCNYRDKGVCYLMQAFPSDRYSGVGSDFVGEVIAVGEDVHTVRAGDRVIANNHYTGGVRSATWREGVATNQASRELHVHHACKLVRIPDSMPDDVAAGFAIGAQTAYSMVRRAALRPRARVLVTSARSNTSLFLIGALLQHDVDIYAATTSVRFATRLRDLGVTDVVTLPIGAGAQWRNEILPYIERCGTFDAVFDPMFDLHLPHVLGLVAPFGAYVTCGLAGQNPGSRRATGTTGRIDLSEVLDLCLFRNITLIANCIGLEDDLQRALGDWEAGRLPVSVDSVFSGDAVTDFLDRSFNDPDRWGKVIYAYA